MKMKTLNINVVVLLSLVLTISITAIPASAQDIHPVESLVGENLLYDVSFLWFEHLAEGSIRLERGDKEGTYLAVMEARTLGLAAFVTKHRVEKYQTLMEVGPDALLRPLRHSSHTFKGKGAKQKEKQVIYDYDHDSRQVHYRRIRDGRVASDELVTLEGERPVFDFVSAFYNFRLGLYGSLDGQQRLVLPTFYRKNIEEIVIEPLPPEQRSDKKFFSTEGRVCKVLIDPSVFKTKGRDVYISIDQRNRLERGIIKNVIGLGDVRGVLRQEPVIARNNNRHFD